jgi:hypothetical protein
MRDSDGLQMEIAINYSPTWLPNSRTTFQWSNNLSNFWNTNTGAWLFGRRNLSSGFIVDYFFSYPWIFRLQASVQLQHFAGTIFKQKGKAIVTISISAHLLTSVLTIFSSKLAMCCPTNS